MDKPMTDERLDELWELWEVDRPVDPLWPLDENNKMVIEILQALKTERDLFKVYREFMLLTTEPRKAAQE